MLGHPLILLKSCARFVLQLISKIRKIPTYGLSTFSYSVYSLIVLLRCELILLSTTKPILLNDNVSRAHCSKSSFFVQKFNFAKPPIFSPVFHPNFFWQFFSWKQSCQQLKSPKPQHFHEFFTPQKNRQFYREIKVEFLDKKWRFRTVCSLVKKSGFLLQCKMQWCFLFP